MDEMSERLDKLAEKLTKENDQDKIGEAREIAHKLTTITSPVISLIALAYKQDGQHARNLLATILLSLLLTATKDVDTALRELTEVTKITRENIEKLDGNLNKL